MEKFGNLLRSKYFRLGRHGQYPPLMVSFVTRLLLIPSVLYEIKGLKAAIRAVFNPLQILRRMDTGQKADIMATKDELAGRRIKLVRKVLSKSQEAMAEVLDVDARTLRRWEAGELSSKGLETVATAVNLPAWYFYIPEPDGEFEKRLFAGLQAREQSPGDIFPKFPAGVDDGGLRQVTKIIYLIKALSEDDNTPLLLSYFSPDWRGMNLLPHANLPELASKDVSYAEHMLANRFGLSILDVSVAFDRDDAEMRSVRIKRTQDPVKAQKHGAHAQYNFFYAIAQIQNPPKRLLDRYFQRGKLRYQWVGLDYLNSFPDIKENNADVLDFLQSCFGSDLNPLPLAFAEPIKS